MTATPVQAGRGPLSRLAGARARTLAALVLGPFPPPATPLASLGLAASEESPAARTPSLASAKPQPRTSELDQREIVARGLLLASRDGSKSFESVEEDLDEIAFAIKRPIQPMLLLSLGLRMNMGFMPRSRTACMKVFES
jgi:hypothetical protein